MAPGMSLYSVNAILILSVVSNQYPVNNPSYDAVPIATTTVLLWTVANPISLAPELFL